MTCKDCLLFGKCRFDVHFSDGDLQMQCRGDVEEKCEGFVDKSRFVELPCKVGDTVYCFAPCFDEIHNSKLKVVEAEILEVRTIATVLGLNFDVDKIGKTVFLTKEEAEKALAERKEK